MAIPSVAGVAERAGEALSKATGGIYAAGAGPSGAPYAAGECPEVRIDIPGGCDGPDIDRWLEPRRPEEGVLLCRVRRLRDKGTLELHIEQGNIFILAATKSGKDWLITEQQANCAKRQHVARLRTHKDRSFTCIRRSAEHYGAPPELLFARHTTVQLSDALPELNTMRVSLPRPPLGLPDCPAGTLEQQTARTVDGSCTTPAPEDIAILESRRPKWNQRSDTYELPFSGRANWASARNFQLVERHGGDRVVLLYGKMEEDEFAMDVAAPLSVLHAFAVILTTWGW